MGTALATAGVSKLDENNPEARREWAKRFAMERAAIGEHATVRQLQDAVKAHFGRGMGNDRACEIINEVAKVSAQEVRARNWSTTSERVAITSERSAPLTAIIVEAMKQLGVKRIELRDDGTLNMTPG